MHSVITSIKYNKIMETALKLCILESVLTVKLDPWLNEKCSEKDAPVENSGQRNSRFKIFKLYIFITLCHLTSSFYVQSM